MRYLAIALLYSALPLYAANVTILVSPFQNTGNAKFSWISAGMTDTVINDLARIKDINIVSDNDRAKVLKEITLGQSGLISDETVARVGKIIGANIILTGSYLVVGDKIRAVARLISVETGKTEKSTKVDGSVDALFDLQDKIVLSLMAEIEKVDLRNIARIAFQDADKRRVSEKQRPKALAFEWYARGLEVKYSDPNSALTCYKKAIELDPAYLDALREAGYLLGNTLDIYGEALDYLLKAEEIFRLRKAMDTIEYVNVAHFIGVTYNNAGQYDKALGALLRAKAIGEKIGAQNSFFYFRLTKDIGLFYRTRGEFKLALKNYAKSEEVAQKSEFQNSYDYARLLTSAGICHVYMKQYRESLENLTKSLALYEKLGFGKTDNSSTTITYIGITYMKKGDTDLALEYMLKAKDIRDKLGINNSTQAGLLLNIGNAYFQKGKADLALEYFTKAKELYEKGGNQKTIGYAELLSDMAAYYEKSENPQLAAEYFRKSFEIYDKASYAGEAKANARNNALRLGS